MCRRPPPPQRRAFTELQTAVNAIRAAAGLGAVTLTDLSLPANRTIRASRITELRTALDAALTQLGLPPVTYTDATITPNVTPIGKAHITVFAGACSDTPPASRRTALCGGGRSPATFPRPAGEAPAATFHRVTLTAGPHR